MPYVVKHGQHMLRDCAIINNHTVRQIFPFFPVSHEYKAEIAAEPLSSTFCPAAVSQSSVEHHASWCQQV